MATFTSRATLSLVNPTRFVNDENVNKVLLELQGNVEYILNFLNGNKALLTGIYGNLWDYAKDGRRILYNGGVADTYKKANVWQALNDLTVANDEEIIWDRSNSRTVYKGQEVTVAPRTKWIEREIWIPETLRDQRLIFAIKASGSTASTGWAKSNAVCETIGIQILGGQEDVQTFKEVGLWNNHNYFSNNSYRPRMRTVIVPFKADKTTTSVKIKIARTENSGYLHIDRVFVGSLVLPYDNSEEVYDIDPGGITGIDINEFFDFVNVKTKILSTTVLGHKVAESRSKIKGNDLVTWHHFNQMMREILTYGSVFTTATTGTTGTSGTSGTPAASGSPDNGNWSLINVQPLYGALQGKINCNTSQKIYTVTHPDLEKPSTPIITLKMPTASSQIFVVGVTDVTDTSFDVVLSDVPSEDGYQINWTLGNAFSPKDAIDSLDLPNESASECPTPTVYSNLFNYETGS